MSIKRTFILVAFSVFFLVSSLFTPLSLAASTWNNTYEGVGYPAIGFTQTSGWWICNNWKDCEWRKYQRRNIDQD
jgi:hypothetical protein